ncbi:leucine-rich repeat-containing protein 69 isoform X1 [Anguilla rostrata]|uniref:leucine-rich repeat-containing protein 69 isoform X1 n=1 Tax=Anguilla rostrata TaxID=7938 RepID=UPI0030CB6CDE
MANNLVIRALRGNAKSFSLSSKNINQIPSTVANLTSLLKLQLNNNCLSTLPIELQSLCHLTELNLGNNLLEEIPPVLKYLPSLRKLYVFGNQIENLPEDIFGALSKLVLLNLNHNKIRVLPPEIKGLTHLEILSLTHNQLEVIPAEIALLNKLTELNLTNNNLVTLPPQLCFLPQLSKLYIARNCLKELPEGIFRLSKLKVLDVAGNCLTMFPVDFHLVRVEELYCEGNAFVQHKLVESIQETEVLSLKEQAARLILMECRRERSVLRRALALHPAVADALSLAGRCALCSQAFLTTWLECVRFVNLRKDMKLRSSQSVPVRVQLCSYSCFNQSGHMYYGVASV